ncbi:MAG: YgaP-like transmembrane domain [Bdellovibrionales bacterium]
MKKNILWWDRLLRFFLGAFMIAWAIAGGPAWA